jgi:hypothetical protein
LQRLAGVNMELQGLVADSQWLAVAHRNSRELAGYLRRLAMVHMDLWGLAADLRELASAHWNSLGLGFSGSLVSRGSRCGTQKPVGARGLLAVTCCGTPELAGAHG